MHHSIRRTRQLMLLIALVAPATACKGSLSVFGNLASMAIAVALLWSTVNINRE